MKPKHYYYIVLSAFDAARIDDVQHNRPHFEYLRDARKHAKEKGHLIFKAQTAPDSGDIIGYIRIK